MQHFFMTEPGTGFPLGFGLPQKFGTAVLENVPAGIVRDTMEQYFADGIAGRISNGIAPLLLGPARTWKTYATCGLIRRMATPYIKFVEGPELAYRLEADAFSDSTKAYTASIVRAHFLVLDDFTAIKHESRAGLFLQYLINHRFSRGMPMLCTGNLEVSSGTESEKALHALYGPLLARRFVDMSTGYRALLHLEG